MSVAQRVLLFDDPDREHFFPLSDTRPIGFFRLGMDTLADKWGRALELPVTPVVPLGLAGQFQNSSSASDLWVMSRLLPDPELVEAILRLGTGTALKKNGELLAARGYKHHQPDFLPWKENWPGHLEYTGTPTLVRRLWHLTGVNASWIRQDFIELTQHRKTQKLHPSNTVIGGQGVFLEEGATVVGSILDDREGPIYIGKNAEIMPGCLLRGPLSIGAESVLKMGAKIYGGTTIGPGCRAGGEISQSILFANSNKGHDGFLGNSILGEWCNLGADTNNSNLKNDYGPVKLWNQCLKAMEDTGEQFCGLFMGDHSKSGINTMFNTGTIVGVSSNVFGSGFPPKFVPSFSWGGANELTTYRFDKALDTASRVMARRNLSLTEQQAKLLEHHFIKTQDDRIWDAV